MTKLKALENAIRLIGYWSHDETKVIKELLAPGDHLKKIVTPFRRELELNLFQFETTHAKRDLIKHYVFELGDLQGLYKEYEQLFRSGFWNIDRSGRRYATRNKSKTRKLTLLENYVVVSWEIFGMLIDEIQISCFKFDIDFLEVCKEIRFDATLVDTSISSFRPKSSGSIDSIPFEYYLTKEGKKLIGYLLETYTATKPEAIVYMLFALIKLQLVSANCLNNQTQLHRALEGSFGRIGTRQNLNLNINKLREPDSYHTAQVEVHIRQIESNMPSKIR